MIIMMMMISLMLMAKMKDGKVKLECKRQLNRGS